jgi:hypothetical protein
VAHHVDSGVDRQGPLSKGNRTTRRNWEGSRPLSIVQSRRLSQLCRAGRAAGCGIIGALRKNSAHLHRPWRHFGVGPSPPIVANSATLGRPDRGQINPSSSMRSRAYLGLRAKPAAVIFAALRLGAHWPLRAMTLRNVSDPKKVRFATRRRASALKPSTMAWPISSARPAALMPRESSVSR